MMKIKSSSKKIRITKMMSSVIAVQLAVMKILQSPLKKIPALVYIGRVEPVFPEPWMAIYPYFSADRSMKRRPDGKMATFIQ